LIFVFSVVFRGAFFVLRDLSAPRMGQARKGLSWRPWMAASLNTKKAPLKTTENGEERKKPVLSRRGRL